VLLSVDQAHIDRHLDAGYGRASIYPTHFIDVGELEAISEERQHQQGRQDPCRVPRCCNNRVQRQISKRGSCKSWN
jgi:hypothetical protein